MQPKHTWRQAAVDQGDSHLHVLVNMLHPPNKVDSQAPLVRQQAGCLVGHVIVHEVLRLRPAAQLGTMYWIESIQGGWTAGGTCRYTCLRLQHQPALHCLPCRLPGPTQASRATHHKPATPLTQGSSVAAPGTCVPAGVGPHRMLPSPLPHRPLAALPPPPASGWWRRAWCGRERALRRPAGRRQRRARWHQVAACTPPAGTSSC